MQNYKIIINYQLSIINYLLSLHQICNFANKKLVTIMSLNPEKPHKLYYSIKEVAKMMNVSESLLRYWETEFPHLRPKTTGNKVRQYTDKNIEQIKVIYNLVKVRGFKIANARKIINENRQGADKTAEVMNTLTSVRDQLKELKLQLDGMV